MKVFIKLLAIVLALSVFACSFAACRKTEDSSDTTDTTDTTETQTSDDEPEDDNIIRIMNIEQLLILVDQLNLKPSASKGVTYKLMVDIDIYSGWDASPSEKLGKFVAPSAITEFPGIGEFYGVFDGNGKTITSVYRVDSEEAGGAVGFIDKLNGGTVRNLTLNTAYVYDNGGNNASVGGLIGVVNGENAALENVTVNVNVYSASDSEATVGGVVGSVAANNFTMKNVTFSGKAGNIGADLTVPSPSASAVLGQLIGNGGDYTITMSNCAANGAVVCNDGVTSTDPFCAAGASNLAKTDCTVTAPDDGGGVQNTTVEIYSASELITAASLASNFEGKTVKLMNDIDLNEGWTAGDTAPANVWQGFAEFKGVFDGNGKIISGIYRTLNATEAANVGFIDVLNGGTVKNLMIVNSAVVVNSESAAVNVGMIGSAIGATVEDVYTDLNISVTGQANANAGGIAGESTGATKLNNIVFAGNISAEGKTAEQIIASTSDAVLSNVLAVGKGAGMTSTGTCVLSEKKDAAFITENTGYSSWSYSGYLGSIAPGVITEKLRFLELVADTSWYNEVDTVFELSTAEQLLGLSQLANGGNTFEGKTIKLKADIDLNPMWNATTKVDSAGTVTLASAANNVWVPIPLFKGTFDGNGYSVSGIYSHTDFEVPATEIHYFGGFIDQLENGKVCNLIINNSLAFFESTTGTAGTTRIRIGGFISHVIDSTLENLYIDIDTWLDFEYHYAMSGMICAFETADTTTGNYSGTVKDIVYAGTTGRIASDGKWSTQAGSSRIYVAGMVGQNHLNNILTNLTMYNLAFTGICYKPANTVSQITGDAVMAFSHGNGAYNSGMATDNYVQYTGSAGMDYAYNTPSATTLTSTATNEYSKGGVVTSETDTYGDAGWKEITGIENGAGYSTIILPGSVVDMLTAAAGR